MQLKLFFFLVRCINSLKRLIIFYKFISEYLCFVSVGMKAAHSNSRQAFIALCQVLGCKAGAGYKWITFWILDKGLFVLRSQKVKERGDSKLYRILPLYWGAFYAS